MVRKIIFVIIFLQLNLIAISQNTTEIKVEYPRHYFGIVSKSKTKFIEVRYTVINYGESSISITKVAPADNTMAVFFSRNKIGKGEKGYVIIRINTQLQREGVFNKAAFIKTSLPENNTIIIRAKGYINN